MNLPPISIVLITYNRPIEIRKTLVALLDFVGYSGTIRWIIADDCSPEPYTRDVLRWWRHFTAPDDVRVITPPINSGWGANANTALSQASTDIMLLCEDDYVLTQPINLDPLVALLLSEPKIGNVRLDGIAGHRVVAHHREADIAAYLPDYQQGTAQAGRLHYWQLDSGSPELWLYSHRPHLFHRRFLDYHGKYIEGAKLGATEEEYAHRVKDALRADPDHAPGIAVPLDANNYFEHIGISYQHTEHDKG